MRTVTAIMGIGWLAYVCSAGEPTFTADPRAVREGRGARITFTVSAPTDVEVAILDADGAVVRHLAAGLLGPTAPEPFAKGSLAQSLAWDGKDDDGRPAKGEPFRVQVGLGMRARLHRIIGWSGQDVLVNRGAACGPDGTLYLVHGGMLYAHRQTTLISAFDRDGAYLRQVLPGPAGLPPERRLGWPHIRTDDGRDVPVVAHLLTRAVLPGAVFANRNFPVVTRDGRLLVVSGASTGTTIKHADARGGRRLLCLGVDGSVPANWLGPVVAPDSLVGFAHLALSPDEKTAYAAGFFEGGKKGRGLCNAVWRVPVDGSAPSRVLAGTLYKAGKGELLNDPQGLATDADGNVYVADYGNNRVAVFSSEGTLIGELPVGRPDQVRVHQRTGAVYVLTLHERTKGIDHQHYYVAAHNWCARSLVKFASWRDRQPAAALAIPKRGMGGGGFLALDESGGEPVLWVTGLRYFHAGRLRVIDRGEKLEAAGDPIADLLKAQKTPPLGFVGDVAVAGPRLLTRHPAFNTLINPNSYVYDPDTGAPTGTFAPRSANGRPENVWNLLYGEMAAGQDGNLYVHTSKGYVRRYDGAGRPLPFAATGGYVLEGFHHGHTRAAGLFADRQGRVVIPVAVENRKLGRMEVRLVSPEGRVLQASLVTIENARVGGVALDRQSNVYLGAQVAPRGKRIPAWAAGRLPPDGAERHPSVDYRQCGAILKFRPGGSIVGDADGPYEAHLAWKQEGPVRVSKLVWVRRIGLHPVKHEIGCYCETTRFDTDEYGRLFVPDIFRFCVHVLDGEGNSIARVGSYGNMDSGGPGSPVPMPEVAFGWPLSVECARERIYVTDVVNRRIVGVRFEHAAVKAVAVE